MSAPPVSPIRNYTSYELAHMLFILATEVRSRTEAAGWWISAQDTNFGEMMMIAEVDLAEAKKGAVGLKMDDTLTHRTKFDAKIADAFICLLEIAGSSRYSRIPAAFGEKLDYISMLKRKPESEVERDGEAR